MGRPPIYHTEEERRMAQNEKSRRSHHKHKHAISLRREARKLGMNNNPNDPLSEASSSKNLVKTSAKPDANSIEFWFIRVEKDIIGSLLSTISSRVAQSTLRITRIPNPSSALSLASDG
ncbi:hypothetical protein H0H92_005491 [Tricholoma furcatifolium]|nr:hypothetical protein H0H92_005491 [Tricholoma furcatifolium]